MVRATYVAHVREECVQKLKNARTWPAITMRVDFDLKIILTPRIPISRFLARDNMGGVFPRTSSVSLRAPAVGSPKRGGQQ